MEEMNILACLSTYHLIGKKKIEVGLVVQPRRMEERHALNNEESHGYFTLAQSACLMG